MHEKAQGTLPNDGANGGCHLKLAQKLETILKNNAYVVPAPLLTVTHNRYLEMKISIKQSVRICAWKTSVEVSALVNTEAQCSHAYWRGSLSTRLRWFQFNKGIN